MRLLAVILTTATLLAACAPAAVPATSAAPASAPEVQSSASASAASSASAQGPIGRTVIKPPPGATAGPDVEMLGYRNQTIGFSLHFPMSWQTTDASANPVVYTLPVDPGTTLVEERLEILTTANAADCKESTYGGASGAPEQVTINGIDLLKETGTDVGAGQIRDWSSYSVMKGSTCINVTFVLHSVAAGVYSTEPAPFDKAQEMQMFDSVISTFQFDQ